MSVGKVGTASPEAQAETWLLFPGGCSDRALGQDWRPAEEALWAGGPVEQSQVPQPQGGELGLYNALCELLALEHKVRLPSFSPWSSLLVCSPREVP